MSIFELPAQMCIFQKLTDSLIYERAETSPETIKEKGDNAYKLAKSLFNIEGEYLFKVIVKKYLKKISQVKPGRVLLKALKVINKTITVKAGKRFKQCGSTIQLVPGKEEYYFSFNDNRTTVSKRPTWISFAHELIHSLHLFSHGELYAYITQDILEGMTDLEEQHTICGYNFKVFLQKKEIHKLDVLCENSFLLSSGLPFRINHLNALQSNNLTTCFIEEVDVDKNTQSYYHWLSRALYQTRVIPEEKTQNQEYILNFISTYPMALASIPETLKQDEAFFLKVISVDVQLFLYAGSLNKSKSFMLKALEITCGAFFFADIELYKDKDFAVSTLRKMEGTIVKKMAFKKLELSLQNDKEILSLM